MTGSPFRFSFTQPLNSVPLWPISLSAFIMSKGHPLPNVTKSSTPLLTWHKLWQHTTEHKLQQHRKKVLNLTLTIVPPSLSLSFLYLWFTHFEHKLWVWQHRKKCSKFNINNRWIVHIDLSLVYFLLSFTALVALLDNLWFTHFWGPVKTMGAWAYCIGRFRRGC